MDSMIIIPGVFLSLIVILFIWAMIFMRAAKQDKKRLKTLTSDDKDKMQQEVLYLEMAESYLNKGDKDKALEYYFLYLRKVANNPDIYYKVGELLYSQNPELAIDYFERAAVIGHKKAVEILKSINLTKDKSPID